MKERLGQIETCKQRENTNSITGGKCQELHAHSHLLCNWLIESTHFNVEMST